MVDMEKLNVKIQEWKNKEVLTSKSKEELMEILG